MTDVTPTPSNSVPTSTKIIVISLAILLIGGSIHDHKKKPVAKPVATKTGIVKKQEVKKPVAVISVRASNDTTSETVKKAKSEVKTERKNKRNDHSYSGPMGN